ncbi:hypothetical protein MRS44_003826 [Fusarium solani]|uniref:uncharacterized protein n=1 Tax=Fusarium solani TaxID=169388 RepID=UPI0032C44A3F|nr:hypothetical protein MRS44_003826 [Fusarium solani]
MLGDTPIRNGLLLDLPELKDLRLSPTSTYSIRRSSLRQRSPGTLGFLCLVNFICAVDGTILVGALSIISSDLGSSTAEGFWVGTSYLLASATFQPLWTALARVLGNAPLMACALGFFTVGTSLASMAKSTALLLAARAIQGLGGGGILALTYVITAEMSSPPDRGRWLGLISSQWAIGSTIAPSVGGALAQYADWRWIFWLNLPFSVLAFILIPFLLRPHGAMAAYFSAFIHGTLVYSLMYYLPIYFQIAHDYSPSRSGIALLPWTMTIGAASLAVGFLISKRDRYAFHAWLGWAAATGGIGMLLSLQRGTSVYAWLASSLVGGIGLGMAFSAAASAAQAAASDTDVPLAGAMFCFLRSIGQAVGVAASGSVFQNAFRHAIEETKQYAAFARQWTRDSSRIYRITRMSSSLEARKVRDVVASAYIDALWQIWLVLTVFSALAMLANIAWFRDQPRQNRARRDFPPIKLLGLETAEANFDHIAPDLLPCKPSRPH